MRRLAFGILILASTLLAAMPMAQAPLSESPDVTRVREELRALFAELHAAVGRRDRAALERLFTEEYVFAHALGFVDNRNTHLEDTLAVEVSGAPPDPLNASTRLYVYGDVAVLRNPLPGGPTSGGRPSLGTTIFAKRSGRWQFVQGQGTLLQPVRKPASVASELLNSSVGRYGERMVVERRGDRLVARGNPQIPPRLLTPVSDTEFYDKRGSQITFGRNTNGEVAYVSLRDGLSGNVVRLERMR